MLNKSVLSFCLKSLLVQADLMLMGRLLQSFWAAAMKHQSPMVAFVKCFGVLLRMPSLFCCKSLFLGAEPWSTLKVIKTILNLIHRWIGNQWSCWKSTVIWQCIGVQKIKCAQAFMTRSFCMWLSGTEETVTIV